MWPLSSGALGAAGTQGAPAGRRAHGHGLWDRLTGSQLDPALFFFSTVFLELWLRTQGRTEAPRTLCSAVSFQQFGPEPSPTGLTERQGHGPREPWGGTGARGAIGPGEAGSPVLFPLHQATLRLQAGGEPAVYWRRGGRLMLSGCILSSSPAGLLGVASKPSAQSE